MCSTQTGTERYTLLIRNVVRTNLLDLSKPRSLNVSGRDRLAQLVKQFGNRVSTATTVNGTFFDVLVPELHVGVVFDSVSVDFYSTPTDKLQRVSKSAQKSGLTCIHVFDWDDVSKIANMLRPKEVVYARKCTIEEVDQYTANFFLRMYHLQGAARGQTKCYGLYYNGQLVSVMTFGKPRYNKNYEWELIRLCYHPEVRVTGGSEKLWKHFLEDVNPSTVLSYCDRAKFSGYVYHKIGMTLKSEGQPSKHWYSSNPDERIRHVTNNFLLQHGYDQIFNESYGKGTDNEELMLKRGFLPIYDCGQMTFEWKG